MRFSDCIAGADLALVHGAEVAVYGVEYDSRRVVPGSLFVAMQGESTDGNRYIEKALQQGAVAVVTDREDIFYQLAAYSHIAGAYTISGRRTLASLSATFFHHPERLLKLSAVTGTNGKTTTAFLLEGILRAAVRTCVLLGTVETHVGNSILPSLHTTPESRDILEVFAQGVHAGATEAVMEMSSHALQQERVWQMPVDVAIFTNLTQDHLDYHRTMDAYAAAKARLFQGEGAPPPRVAIVNADDAYAMQMLAAAQLCEIRWTYSLQDAKADFYAHAAHLSAGSTRFLLRTPMGEVQVQSHLTGRINIYNLVAAIAAAIARGLDLHQVVRIAENLHSVPGRLQTVPNDSGISVVVDYAHTDDALSNLLSIARELLPLGNRILTVFGCGGDRDRSKRPKMGRAAGQQSDFVIVTSDNPRSEDPSVIADEVLQGVLQTDVEYAVELDRHAAIERGISMAHPGDILLIAGKGHEKEQILHDRTVPFDDVAVAAEILQKRKGTP